MDSIQSFKESILANGIEINDEIISDGKIHRFHITGDSPGSLNGWYVLHNDATPSGAYGCWKRGIKKSWYSKSKEHVTASERNLLQQRLFSAKKQLSEVRKSAKENAKIIWEQSQFADITHPYLVKKNIKLFGLRIDKNNRLIIPIYNNNSEICSLQFISPSGDKRFLKGGNIADGYYLIGKHKNPTDPIYIGEGYATCATIHDVMNCATVCSFNCNNILAVARLIKDKFPHADIIIAADNDSNTKGNPGLTKAREAAKAINAKIVYPKFLNIDALSKPSDFNDLMIISGRDTVKNILGSVNGLNLKEQSLPILKTDVMQLQPEMLPEALRSYVFDVAARQQCAPDFIAVTAIIALSSLLGRKAVIRPKQQDDWEVTPNQWGAIIGRPSAMKSPSMKEALKPLREIDSKLAKTHKEETFLFEKDINFSEIEQKAIKEKAKVMIKKGNRSEAMTILDNCKASLSTPIRKRLIVNDSTIEKLGELLNENPNGLLLVRDELPGWLSQLLKEDGQQDRAFYLECFDGNSYFVYDRIGRGTIEIKNCTLSIIGGIQPSKILPLLKDAMNGHDDGLIQRFQLIVWPDDITSWVWVDQAPHQTAKDRYFEVFEEIYALKLSNDDAAPITFHFSESSQKLFISWMEKINKLARGNQIHSILESYILKMPQTIAGLALLFELINKGRERVEATATNMALMWADYLLSHAQKLYSNVINQSLKGAHLLLERKTKLHNPFTIREIQRKGWASLDNNEMINEALNWLLDYGYLTTKETPSVNGFGGRPTIYYEWTQKK
jgi:phage/plasmid primase-like uncharacterized protein